MSKLKNNIAKGWFLALVIEVSMFFFLLAASFYLVSDFQFITGFSFSRFLTILISILLFIALCCITYQTFNHLVMKILKNVLIVFKVIAYGINNYSRLRSEYVKYSSELKKFVKSDIAISEKKKNR